MYIDYTPTKPKIEMVVLSASKIKTLQHCSWIFHSRYILKVPDTTNDGAKRGTVTHSILESLINPRHKKHYDKIVKDGTILKHAGVTRFTKNLLRKQGLSESELETVDSFTMVALRLDFLLDGYDLEKPEYKFVVESEKPKYKILGYIDKMGIRKDVAKIVDYKTSKSKPDAKEQNFNIQGMMYVLAAKKLWPNVKKAFVNFLYLKFKQSPKLVFTCSDEKLAGFELYLEYLNDYLENWDLGKAKSNFGYDDYQKRRLCGKKEGGIKEDGSPVWQCPMMLPKDYFVLIKNGEVTASAFEEKDLTPKENESIEKRRYLGCPRFSREEVNESELF